MLRTHRAGKGPGGFAGWGLGSTEQKGPRRVPHSWSQRAGDLTWEPSKFPGLEWMGQTPSSPLLLLPQRPSHLPLLFSPQPPSYASRTNAAGGEVALEGGDQPGSPAAFLGSSGRGNLPPLLSCSSHRALLPASRDLPGLRGPILSGLHFSSPLSPPTSYWFIGGSSRLLGHQGPPSVAGRSPSCGETVTWHLLTPPS